MRILLVSDYYPPSIGGVQRQTRTLAQALPALVPRQLYLRSGGRRRPEPGVGPSVGAPQRVPRQR